MGTDDDVDLESDGTRRTRWSSLVRVAAVRFWRRTVGTRSSRAFATIGAVAMTIALLLVVTGVALGLAGGGAVDGHDADAQIVPAESGSLSTVDGVEEPRLGETNQRADAIRTRAGIDHASPVLVEPVRFESADGGDAQTVLLVGVVPDAESRTVGGLPTDSLDSNGSQSLDGWNDGRQRGTIVLSRTAASRLDATTGDELSIASSRAGNETPSITVTGVEPTTTDDDETPIGLVRLTDLQALAGADGGQLADSILIWGERDAAASAAADYYPDATVEMRDRTDPSSLFGDGLAFATSVMALIVGVAICASFVATTAGMTVNEDRRTLAVLESIGYPTHSRLVLVSVSTLFTTLCGAFIGIILGIAGIWVVNWAATATIAPGAVAEVHPVFVPYGIVVAFVSGLVAVPYPLIVAARTTVLEEVGR